MSRVVLVSISVSSAVVWCRVGDASVAVTRIVGRLEPNRLLATSEGTIDSGRTVTLPAASVVEKKASSACKFCCCSVSSPPLVTVVGGWSAPTT